MTKPSSKPQRICNEKNRNFYYYEDAKGINVCSWDNENFHDVRIPWTKLIKSLKRCQPGRAK